MPIVSRRAGGGTQKWIQVFHGKDTIDESASPSATSVVADQKRTGLYNDDKVRGLYIDSALSSHGSVGQTLGLFDSSLHLSKCWGCINIVVYTSVNIVQHIRTCPSYGGKHIYHASKLIERF
jgi:hypothetical protein